MAKRTRFQISIALVLVGGISLLLLIAGGGVLFITFSGARQNTDALLQNRAAIGLELLEQQVRGELAPVETLGINLAEMIARGEIDVADAVGAAAAFRLAMTAVPQASAVVFVGTDFRAVRYSRDGGGLEEVIETGLTLAGLGGMADTMDGLQGMLDGAATMAAPTAWLPPLWVGELQQPVLNLEVPVNRGDQFLGALLIVVELGEIAEFLAELEADKGTSAFVLYGMDHVLAHPSLATMMGQEGRAEMPLPAVDMFDDPAFALIRGEGRVTPFSMTAGVDDAYVNADYEVNLRELAGLGAEPWRIGLKFPAAERGVERRRLNLILIAAVAILAISVIIASLIGRALTRSIGQLAGAAERLTTLDISQIGEVPPSRFRELGRAAGAFNTMTQALRWFEIYVPKSLVMRLMRQADGAAMQSEEREVTVMFTDIRGFSTMSERMRSGEIAALLNDHFELLSRCIEAEGGTVDKFIGDSVMAFWGAPEPTPDHRPRAVLAAQAIRAAVTRDNEARRARGAVEVPVRIGIHSGAVVVGNIGSSTRVNYTVVGDPVNAASRLEQLGKEQAPEDCIVLLSEATARDCPDLPLTRLGEQSLKGKAETVVVYRLD